MRCPWDPDPIYYWMNKRESERKSKFVLKDWNRRKGKKRGETSEYQRHGCWSVTLDVESGRHDLFLPFLPNFVKLVNNNKYLFTIIPVVIG